MNPGASRKFVILALGVILLCLGGGAALQFVARRFLAKAAQPSIMIGPGGTEKDSIPEGTVRRGAVTRHSVPKEEQPASRVPFTRRMPAPIALKALPVESEEVHEAVALMGKWKACATWREKLPLTLRHDRSEEFMQFFYDQRKGSDPDFALEPASPAVLVAGDERIVLIHLPSHDRADGFAQAYFHRTLGGGLRLDWDSFVGMSDLSWRDIRERRPVTPVLVRGYVTLDDYHNYEFTDARKFLSLKVRSPDGDVALSAFCLRDSALGQFFRGALRAVPDRTNKDLPLAERPLENLPAVLAVRFTPRAQSDHCVELLETVAGRWLLFDGENALTGRPGTRVSDEIINNFRDAVLGTESAR